MDTDFDRFEGTFGAAEARRLCDRYAFGCTPELVDELVGLGLDGAVNKLTTWNPEARHRTYPGNPLISDLVRDASCDGYIKGEEQDGSNDGAEEDCNLRNRNDRDLFGVRSRLYIEAFGDNSYFAKCVAFLSDEAEAPTMNFAGSDYRYRHLAEKYTDDLWMGCITGNYEQYIRDCFVPTEGSGYCSAVLNVIGNRNPSIPNEDGARELLELGTVGYKKLDGALNYYPEDVAQNALAFTGWVWSEITEDVGEQDPVSYFVPSFSSAAYQSGDKTLFARDDQNRTAITDMNSSVTAAFAHPETAVELAEKVCREFIAKNCSNSLVLQLAKVVRDSNFNLTEINRQVMKSKVFYSSETKNKLIKHPMELALGFLKQVGFPVGKEPMSLRDIESRMLERMGQRAFLPPTIFGFYEDELEAEVKVLDRGTAMFNAFDFDPRSIEENIGYSIRQRFMSNLPAGESDSIRVVKKLAEVLNIDLTQEQFNQADTFLNYYRDDQCQNYEVSSGVCTEAQLGQPYDRRDKFDLGSAEWKYVERVQGLLVIMAQSFGYQAK